MNELPEVQMPPSNAFAVCKNPEHWFEVVTNEFCHSCLRGRKDTEDMKAKFVKEDCKNCGGSGYVTEDSMSEGEFSQYESPCPDCNGVSDEDKHCDMSGATDSGDR